MLKWKCNCKILCILCVVMMMLKYLKGCVIDIGFKYYVKYKYV